MLLARSSDESATTTEIMLPVPDSTSFIRPENFLLFPHSGTSIALLNMATCSGCLCNCRTKIIGST
ncbi:hypothetical protein KCP70_19650 [Salmonella enterica subsp. enterica]|nr:hypothetical protein KCP70_19650 [Salmonella enterica subsp. enterica]